ncbi:hypothetical protein [Desulfotalea psychrophila]|uniref:Uncharacterized protein n=1 Tax=Desulfotalea psychrophila (strain LSv54 / DSM 12343) TaxID=177439 RepID=Q6ANH8_DESPS|nr:hypothetical protein [Desulfotalea psychrophila]CAG36096.1 unknown protein [Desulfotalea psychrophila LSv54]
MANQLQAEKHTHQSQKNSQAGRPRSRARRLSWWASIVVCLFMLTAVWYNFGQREEPVNPTKTTDNWIQGYQAALMQKQQIKREWIVSHAQPGSPWHPDYYKENLGEYKVIAAKNNGANTSYYFSEADMTFIINDQKEIVTWMAGQNK